MPLEAVVGPVDFLLLEFPGDADTKACSDALIDLVQRDTVHLYDLKVIRKAADGSYSGLELTDVTSSGIGGFRQFSRSQSGLIGDDDVDKAAAAMRPDTMAALIVFENAWAAPFVGAVLDTGGEVIASERIPAMDVMAALDRLDESR